MSKLRRLLAKHREKREERAFEMWLKYDGWIVDPYSSGKRYCGCIVPLLFWGGILTVIAFAVYKLFF